MDWLAFLLAIGLLIAIIGVSANILLHLLTPFPCWPGLGRA